MSLLLFSLAAFLLSFSNCRVPWCPWWMRWRQLSLSSTSRCHVVCSIPAWDSWPLLRFLGAPRFRFPSISSPKKTAFGKRISSTLATWPAHLSWCLSTMDSMLDIYAFFSTLLFVRWCASRDRVASWVNLWWLLFASGHEQVNISGSGLRVWLQ